MRLVGRGADIRRGGGGGGGVLALVLLVLVVLVSVVSVFQATRLPIESRGVLLTEASLLRGGKYS